MRAAKIKEHPGFLLMKQTDVQSIYYMHICKCRAGCFPTPGMRT